VFSILYRHVSRPALWPSLVYNLNNTEQVAAQRVRNFAPSDSTTKFLDERLDGKSTITRFHLPYNFPYKHYQGQNSARCLIVFERQFIFRENYASVKMLSADIFASVTIKELYNGARSREFQALPC